MNGTLTITFIEYNYLFNYTQFINSPLRILSFSLLIFINFSIFASNLFMIIILLLTKNKRFDATRKFLINLSIIDMNFALYIMPISIMYIILKIYWISYYIIIYYIWIIFDIYFCTTIMLNLVIIAFDKMLAINYAVKYNQIMSPTRVRLLILLIWLLALLIILPLIFYIIWYQLQLQSSNDLNLIYTNVDITNSLHNHNNNNNDNSNDCTQYKCNSIHVSIYIRLFISICSMYIPTGLMCYFYFHVFSKVIINKRGISIGLLIDNDNNYHRQLKKKQTSFNDDNINKEDYNKIDDNSHHNDNNNNKGVKSKKDKMLKDKNTMNHSKHGLLRVHVGGKQLLCNNNTFKNHKYNSTTNINNIHNNISQHVKLINNEKKDIDDSTLITNTLSVNSSIKNQDDLYDQPRSTSSTSSSLRHQQQHSSLTTEFITSNDYTSSNQKSYNPNSTTFNKTTDKLENNNNNNEIVMKKHSNSLSEVFLKVNRNTLNDSNNNNNKQMINQQPDTSQQQQQHNLKDKLANILRKHSFHTLSPYTYIKPSELTQSRRSTGRTDKDTKFNDIITLRRCALMPLNNNTACSSISNEYMNSGRNSENLSNLSTTFITPRNSNQLDRLTNITQDQLYSSTSTNYNGNNKLKRSIEFKAISMFLFNLSSILLCWLPYYTLFLFTDHLPNLCLSFTVYEFFYWLRFLCIAFNPLIYGSASEDLRKAFKRFILHCGKVKHEKKALKRLVLAGLGAAGIPYGHRIIIPQQMKSSDYNQQQQQQNRSVIFNKPLMIIADMDDKT